MNAASISATRPLAEKTDVPAAPPEAAAPDAWEGVRIVVGRGLDWFDRRVGRLPLLRMFAIVLLYAFELGGVFHVAYELRWDFDVPAAYELQRLTLIVPIVLCKLLMLYSFGQFRTVQSYFGLADFGAVLVAMSTLGVIMIALWLGADASAAPPRGVILMDFVLSIALVSCTRLVLRVVRSTYQVAGVRAGQPRRRIAIIGAGDTGEALAKELLTRPAGGLQPVCFFDENADRVGRSIHGLPVYGPWSRLPGLARKLHLSELVVAHTGLGPRRLKEIVALGQSLGLGTQIVPSATQLATGEVKVERTRPVAIEDLLGRATVNLEDENVVRLVRDRVVLVTGAGGSIGSELCRQILRHGPKHLVLVDQAEIALFEIEQELSPTARTGCLRPLIVDVAEETAVRELMQKCRPEVVFHAAAHKHVPIMERQPAEALKNNSFATAMLTRLAAEAGVSWFVFISTDKAINPTSVMGCSKRLAEMALQARQRVPGHRTRFMAVRFGNVLGSSGSVIPVFRRQIAQGGPVTVTHRDMTRYFMTIPEAVGLVLQAATLGVGGEIFILDMGEPVKIVDLARQMIELSGYKPDVDIEIKFTGLRPGEKLFEELRHTDETHETTAHPRIFKLSANAAAQPPAWLDNLRDAMAAGGSDDVKRAMKAVVPEYQPYHE